MKCMIGRVRHSMYFCDVVMQHLSVYLRIIPIFNMLRGLCTRHYHVYFRYKAKMTLIASETYSKLIAYSETLSACIL